MTILLVSATAMEIAPFIREYSSKGRRLPETDILITGVGLTSTTYKLTRQLHLKQPGLVIQAGLAGSFVREIKMGAVFVVKKEVIADLSVVEQDSLNTIFDLGLAQPDAYPFDAGWLVNKSSVLKKTPLKKVTAVSVNEISTSSEKINLYRKKFDPAIESLEGAALHYVCLMEKVPFIQLRAVSNYIGERDKKNWKLKESVLNLNQELVRLLNSL